MSGRLGLPAALLGLVLVAAAAGCGSAQKRSAATTTGAALRPVRRVRLHRPKIVSPHDEAVPILMYHVVGKPPAGTPFPQLYVRRRAFAAQLGWLGRHGYTPVSLQRVYDYWRLGFALPARPVVLTFDDGYRQDFTTVRPLLLRRHWSAVLNLEVRNVLDRTLTVPQLRALIRSGWEIDAHTLTHRDLTTLRHADLRHEVAGSRAWIRRHFHVPVDFFCYPAGRYDAGVVSAVRAAGFVGATTEEAGAASPRDGLLTLPRIRVDRSDGVSALAWKLGATRRGGR